MRERLNLCTSHGMPKAQNIISVELIAIRIYLMRGEKVMLDSDLAQLYGIPTNRLNEQFKRNRDRFPPDFAFQMTKEELESLMSQIATSNSGRGGRRKIPWVFTEHGVAMLSSILRSKKAVQVNISIIRTFVKLREVLATHKDLAREVEQHDHQIAILFDRVQKILAPPNPPKHPIGYVHPKDWRFAVPVWNSKPSAPIPMSGCRVTQRQGLLAPCVWPEFPARRPSHLWLRPGDPEQRICPRPCLR